MIRGIKLEGHKELTKNKDILVYDKPKYVYIPLICHNDTNVTIKTKVGDRVLKGDILGLTNTLPIISSVSGEVIEIVDKVCYTGNKIKCIKIKNDCKEITNKYELKEIDKYSKQEYIKILEDCGIRGMGGADFPTYIKYKKNIKNLIINATECEPYITSDYILLKHHYQEIIECIDAIMTINKIENGFIALHDDNINLINNIIGTYPKIKIVKVPNIYPIGWSDELKKYILHNDISNTIVNNVSTIYTIYNALKYHEGLNHRIVTLSGNMLKKQVNVDVKIGTDIVEVLETLGYKKRELYLIAGGPMMGNSIREDELIVTPNLGGVLLLKETENGLITECINCGKCNEVCPAKLNPVLIKDNLKDKELLKKLHCDDCIECGLCSYICPANLMVREFVKRAKNNIRGE